MTGFVSLMISLVLVGDQFASSPETPEAGSWAGTYTAGGEASDVIKLALNPDGTFSGLVQDFTPYATLRGKTKEEVESLFRGTCGTGLGSRGTWQQAKSIITLKFESGSDVLLPDVRIPARWMAISWDDRRYLVPEGRIIDFCNEINFGFEPRSTPEGRFALRAGDHETPARGWPTLAEEWRSFLLLEPIQGTIVKIDEDGFGYLDIGETDGLRAGMVLLAYQDGKQRSYRLKVLCPCGPSARVDIIEIPRSEIPQPRDIQVGDVVTTKAL